MKIKGVDLSRAYEDFIVLPRKPKDIVIRARAITSFDEFERLCPSVAPPMVKRPGQKKSTPDFDDRTYVNLSNQRAMKQQAWINIQSLKATEGLEWETVKLDNPETWLGYLDELQKSGFTPIELVAIMRLCDRVNGLNEDALKEARERFLSEDQSSPST